LLWRRGAKKAIWAEMPLELEAATAGAPAVAQEAAPVFAPETPPTRAGAPRVRSGRGSPPKVLTQRGKRGKANTQPWRAACTEWKRCNPDAPRWTKFQKDTKAWREVHEIMAAAGGVMP
jgi:hypothetical protein